MSIIGLVWGLESDVAMSDELRRSLHDYSPLWGTSTQTICFTFRLTNLVSLAVREVEAPADYCPL